VAKATTATVATIVVSDTLPTDAMVMAASAAIADITMASLMAAIQVRRLISMTLA
jgi:hypothetical protein